MGAKVHFSLNLILRCMNFHLQLIRVVTPALGFGAPEVEPCDRDSGSVDWDNSSKTGGDMICKNIICLPLEIIILRHLGLCSPSAEAAGGRKAKRKGRKGKKKKNIRKPRHGRVAEDRWWRDCYVLQAGI